MAMSETQGSTAMRAVAEELLAKTRALDLDGMRALFARDVVFWSNVSQVESGLDQRMAFMALEKEVFDELAIEDVHIDVFDGGFVQQCVFAGTVKGGAAVRVPTCLVVRVTEGQVSRFDEYVSMDHIQPVVDAIAAHLAAQRS
jgi:ketosteroid isomerase-like protein